MNTVPKTPQGAEDDDSQLKHQRVSEHEMVEGQEEESGVFTSAPSLARLNKKLEANKAFTEEIKRKNGYFERRIEAEMHAKQIAADKGRDEADKYLDEFEKREAAKVVEIAKREGTEEQFDYERAAPPRQKIEAGYFESSVESTKAQVLELLTPLELDAGDLFTKSGGEILKGKMSRPFLGIIESGGKKPLGVKTSFNGAEVVAVSSPGLRKANGEYPENRDGLVLMKTPDGKGFQVVMSHGVSEGPEAAALANAASVSAGYDLNRMHPSHLTEIFDRANEQVNAVKKELDVPKQRLALVGVTVKKENPGDPLYDVEVLNAGDAHCLVIDKTTGNMVHARPATVSGELEAARMPIGRRKDILSKYSKATGAPADQIERILVMSAGQAQEAFRPLESHMQAAPTEIVVVASSDFMRAMGGHEYFQDGTFAKQLSAHLKQGQKLNEAIVGITKNIIRRQKEAKIEDGPVSIVAFEIPGAEKLRMEPKKEETVEDILKKAAVPLELDFEELGKEKSA